MDITKTNEILYFIAAMMSGLMMLCGGLMFLAGLWFFLNIPLAITMMICGAVMFGLGDVFVRILMDMEREIL